MTADRSVAAFGTDMPQRQLWHRTADLLGVMSNEGGQGSGPNFRFSAKAAAGLMDRIVQQSVAYLPFSLERSLTAAFTSAECELPTLCAGRYAQMVPKPTHSYCA